MKKLFILLMACISLAVQGYAQAPNVLPQVFSPNAAELGKYGKVPVSYFNGLPNISIPLTELKAKGYTLPVYLTYHAGGNKPDQHPGWVGQGWALHAGGCINRIINGKKDELTALEYDMEGDEDYGYLYHAREFQSVNWADSASANQYMTKHKKFCDFLPDEFQINVDGINASFYIIGKDDIKIVSQSDADFTISYSMNTNASASGNIRVLDQKFGLFDVKVYDTFSEFILTNKDGTKYYFGGYEDSIEYSIRSRSESDDWDLVATANTWMLTKIVRTNGEEIHFNYERNGIPIVEVDNHQKEYAWWHGLPCPGVDTFSDNRNISFYFLLPSYLESVRCSISDDYLLFSTGTSVQLGYDYSQALFLSRVGDNKLYEYLTPQNYYEQLESIESPRSFIALEYTKDATTRLKLDTVKVVAGQNDVQKYVMRYNSTPLPPGYYSRRTDAWGYYNYEERYMPAADKFTKVQYIVNAEYQKAEILEEINTRQVVGHVLSMSHMIIAWSQRNSLSLLRIQSETLVVYE